MTTYPGWWQVPPHLLPATALGELEYPRTADGQPIAAWVQTRDWRDKKVEVALYDARTCPPSTATAAQLATAARTSKRQQRRRCADCGARCQRPLPLYEVQGSGPLCPACRHIALLRRHQAQLAAARHSIAARAGELLAWPHATIVQVDLTVPPPAPSGRRRPPTAARVRAVGLAGERLVDVLVRLVGPRAQHVPADAVAPEQAVPAIHQAVLGWRLIMWSIQDLQRLRLAAPHQDLPRLPRLFEASEVPQPHLPIPDHVQAVAVEPMATRWRGQVDPTTRALIACLAPGTPDRLLLMLQRIAATGSGGADPPALTAHGGELADQPRAARQVIDVARDVDCDDLDDTDVAERLADALDADDQTTSDQATRR